MANIELLLCMGLPHGADPRRMLLPASGTNPAMRLDWTDVHKAMGHCTPEQKAILYLKPNLAMVSGAELAALTAYLWRSLIRFESKRRAKRPLDPTPAEKAIYDAADKATDARQAAMIQTALAEYRDSRVCRTCYRNTNKNGHVQQHVEGKGVMDVVCPRCQGAGWLPWSDNRRYRGIGGDRNAYLTRIAPGYEHLLHACTQLYRQGEERFMHALFAEVETESPPLQARA